MRRPRFLFFLTLLALTLGWASAQESHVKDVPQPAQPAQPAAQGVESDPVKVADFQKRFAEGQELEKQGKLAEARTIFEGILAEDPNAKGSLREAGIISVRLNELIKANEYFERLHAIVPDYPGAIESLIQVNQALKRDVKVELLLKEFHDLNAAGKVPKPYFVRERVHLDPGMEIVFTEFFDYTQEPYTLWMAEVFNEADGQLKRRLLLNYDPRGTKELRAGGPKLANAEEFLLIEDVLKDGQVTQIDAYFQMFALPEYSKTRSTMIAIIAGAYKPVYSQPVDAAGK